MGNKIEDSAEILPGSEDAPKSNEDESFKAITSQEDLDRIVQARVARVEAKYADYDDLKAKWQEIEDSSKSELEKATARAEAAEQAAQASVRRALVLEAANKYGVPADYINLIAGDDEEAINLAAEQVGTLAANNAKSAEAPGTPVKFFDPGQSGNSAPDEDAVKEAFARQLFQV